MPYTTILFDLDHTLLDSDESERLAFRSTMTQCGLVEPDGHLATYQTINTRLWKSVERGERSPNDVKHQRFNEFAEQVGLDLNPHAVAELYTAALGAHGELYPGVEAMLDAVAGNAQLALITNGIGSVQRARIERLGLGSRFAGVAISGELGVSKPDPAIFDHVFKELGQPERETSIIVGDSLTSDMAGGHNAGIDTCWFNRHQSTGPELAPTIEVATIAEMAPALLS